MFGTHNKRKIQPKENINFSQNSSRNALMPQEAQQIANSINAYFEDPYTLSMRPGGHGTLIYTLLDSPLVDHIYVSTYSGGQRKLIENNLRAYSFPRGRVTFFRNPQELDRDDSSLFYTDLIDVKGFNLDETLKKGHYFLYAFRVPKGYTKTNHPGYVCELQVIEGGKGDLMICQPLQEGGEEEPLVEEVMPAEAGPEYLEPFLTYIDSLLARIIPSPEERESYFTPSGIAKWVQAFTHKTVDTNTNYDVLEMIGDRAMKFGFADYITQRIEGVSERQLSELQNYYLSKIQQSKLASDLGMGEWIRKAGGMNVSLLEDVTESFFGALFKVSEEVQGGMGYYNIFQMIVSLYELADLEAQMKIVERGADKSVVAQNLQRLHLPGPVEEVTRSEKGVHTATIKLLPEAITFFRRYGFNIPEVIATATGKTKMSASRSAYTLARRFLDKEGITDDWVDDTSNVLTFAEPRLQPFLATAQQRLEREGYTRMKFATTQTANECLVQLLGVRPDKSEGILATTRDCDQNDARVAVLRAYASGL